MKENAETIDSQKPLQINVNLEQPLKGLFLEQCVKEGRTRAGLLGFILRQYYAERVLGGSNRLQQKDGGFYHYPDETLSGEAEQKEAD